MTSKSQYATIPIELLEIETRKKKIKPSYKFHLFKITPYKSLKLNSIVVKVGDETTQSMYQRRSIFNCCRTVKLS